MLTIIFNWFAKNIKSIAVIIILILTAITFLQRQQIKKQIEQIDRYSNNVEYYQQQLSDKFSENRTLQFSIDEYKTSVDSLIVKINQTQKELKIKDKQLKQAQLQHQTINIDTTVIVKDCDFIKEIKPNNLTSLIIIKKDSLLTAKIDIRNEQTLFLTSQREYRNKYKNWFIRLIHFDFKKKNTYKYQIHNSNPIIKTESSRIVEIQK